MPVPTETYWNIRRLNLVFAASALALLGATGWLVFADYNREWRGYQREARVWQVAMTRDAQQHADYAAQALLVEKLQKQIDDHDAQLQASTFKELDGKTIAEANAKIVEYEQELARMRLPTATVKGEIGPLTQQIERLILTHGADSQEVIDLQTRLAEYTTEYEAKAATIVDREQKIVALNDSINLVKANLAQLRKERDNAARSLTTVQERLAKLSPTGTAKLSKIIRDAPLLDWFNPTEKVQQVVVPQIRTDLNFLSVETIDRCASCHINIDDPAFERSNLMLFIERQVAIYEGQDVDSINHPVVMSDFWRQAASALGPLVAAQIQDLDQSTFNQVNILREQAEQQPLESIKQLPEALERIATVRDSEDALVRRSQWYKPLEYYVQDLKQLVRENAGEDQFALLADLYREALTQRYNGFRAGEGLSELDTSPVLLGHPKLDLYVSPDSSHPMKTMGCTSCHEGSGQETQFEHTSHMPREIWVDSLTGAPVPAFLVQAAKRDGPSGHATADDTVQTGFSFDGASPAYASAESTGDSHAQVARYSHTDVKLTDTDNPAPFAPVYEADSQEVQYLSPGEQGAVGSAVRQADYWNKQYHWHAVHYMHWEKPMHQLEYIESSCNKCHTEIFDIQHEAPRLFKGRKLFAQLGCANCHTVESLQDDLDVKRVGPSLVHVKHKLSAPMMASWIWSPRSFRPMAKMPHYFMLENNSSPIDILRTRTEVAAMTHYLIKAQPATDTPAYEPEPPPEESGNAVAGKAIFNSVGCLACHTNMSEHGEQWISQDLVDRTGVTEEQAKQRANAMSYNEQHWYAMEHLGEKLERAGPELSGVGTKLKSERTEEQAHAWAYDWVRNPRHYSSYTIMPSFRLSPQEANDLAAYLLTLERPNYETDSFGLTSDGQVALDDKSKHMLTELVAQLSIGQGTIEMARQHAAEEMSEEDRLYFLGKKMISHYGCNSCHLVNGFEEAAATCASLDDWGLKDPHKLDFGYFDHAFDQNREQPTEVWKVDHEGLESTAPHIKDDSKKLNEVEIQWEHIEGERRPWLYHKVHNPRVYDRGRTSFDGSFDEEGQIKGQAPDIGKPYDKLKMPKFFLPDQDVQALVTFVTGVRKPLVDSSMQTAVMDNTNMRLVRGRQVATLYNCYGCHNIEGNSPSIWEYMDVHNPGGGFNYDALNNAPPRLIGQGAKTQPDWLFNFIHDVHPLRPWLKVRMPSFPVTTESTTSLVDYFAASSQDTAQELAKLIAAVDEHRQSRPDDDRWFENPRIDQSIASIRAFALDTDLVRQADLDERETTIDERRATWDKLIEQVRFMQSMTDVHYPFSGIPASDPDPEWFARGEALFGELRCIQCHALGEEDKLLALWKLDNPDIEDGDGFGDSGDDEYDEYGDDEGYGDDEEGYGDDEGYGDEEEEAVPVGPVYSAPNLSYTARRLQWQWVDQWLQEPATIQPGTKMPQWFPGGVSAFGKYPASVKDKMHSMYGFSGPGQRKLLMDFIYEAGRRNYTPGADRLGGTPTTKIELKPMALPPKESAASTIDDDKPEATTTTTTQAEPIVEEAAPAPKPEPVVLESQIENFHDDPQAPYTADGTGRVIGQVNFDGKRPRRKPVRMSSDAICAAAHKGTKVLNESMVVNKDSTVQNVFVYVKSGLPAGHKPKASNQPAVIDQKGCQYIPHVQAVVVGQPLQILNSDSTLHNVKMNSANNGSFNEGMPVVGMVLDKVLSKPEMKIPLKCDVHPWMSSYLYVMEHPYFSVSDIQGRFEISGLPPGDYVLEAVHESKKIPPVTINVTVEPDTSHRSDMTIGAK